MNTARFSLERIGMCSRWLEQLARIVGALRFGEVLHRNCLSVVPLLHPLLRSLPRPRGCLRHHSLGDLQRFLPQVLRKIVELRNLHANARLLQRCPAFHRPRQQLFLRLLVRPRLVPEGAPRPLVRQIVLLHFTLDPLHQPVLRRGEELLLLLGERDRHCDRRHRHDSRLVHPRGRLIPENLGLEGAARRDVLAWIHLGAAGQRERLASRHLLSDAGR
mmetsp:Transcript_52367/g.124736  ORF Transcript_52367/g.124736 Transcript_52367/m.124736 type:complete len:218 (-) Transcript_52367:50-703(-)